MPHFGRQAGAAVAAVLCKRLEAMRATLRFMWRQEYVSLRERTSQVQGGALLFNIAAVCAGRGVCESRHSQVADGLARGEWKLWGWEGCFPDHGCCHGSCTHVWNYAQAFPHLYPQLERTLRDLELVRSMDERGHVNFRGAIPDGPVDHDGPAAADGQLGGIMKVYRDWQISGDSGLAEENVSAGEAQPGLLHSHLGPGSSWERFLSRTTTPTTLNSGARTACAPASIWERCRPWRRWRGQRAVQPARRLLWGPGEALRAIHGRAALQRRVLSAEDSISRSARHFVRLNRGRRWMTRAAKCSSC